MSEPDRGQWNLYPLCRGDHQSLLHGTIIDNEDISVSNKCNSSAYNICDIVKFWTPPSLNSFSEFQWSTSCS
jgi:hypothetical protein